MVVIDNERSMALVKKTQRTSVIDNVNDIAPVMDYSFCRISCIADTLEDEPRNYNDPRLTPRQQANKQKEDEQCRQLSKSRSFLLNNNGLTELTGLRETMTSIFENIDNVAWLNLSFNEIATLDPLLELPHLEILYMHGNCVSDLAEIEKLGVLNNLKRATFHGNPVENVKGYRQFTLASLVHLRALDFSDVTREDRRRIHAWKMVNKSKKKKVVVEDE